MIADVKEPKYQAAKYARFKRTDVQKYARALDELERKHGGITPAMLVQEAKSPKSIFHDLFTWDPKKAAHLYRLEEARHFIRTIKVELQHVGRKKPQRLAFRLYHNVVDEEGERSYVGVEAVRSNQMYRAQLIAECQRELKRVGEKLSVFKDLRKYATVLQDVARKLK